MIEDPTVPHTALFDWESAFYSHEGAVRRVNEDSCLNAPEMHLWAVADGMGGHEGGQLASCMVIDALDTLSPTASGEVFVEATRRRLQEVNGRLREIAAERFNGRVIGSTVAVLLALGGSALILWAGDSRIYRWRNGQLTPLTRDHSLVEEMIAQGLIEAHEAAHHPQRNVITRAIGAGDVLDLEERREELQDGDTFLICSDGLNKMLSDEEIASYMAPGSCDEVSERLMRLALDRGASDNVTVGVVRARRTGPSASM